MEKLKGARIRACDLRAGAALVMAGLAADGYTIVSDIEYIQRGYEHFEQKLRDLGGRIALVENDDEIREFMQKTAD